MATQADPEQDWRERAAAVVEPGVAAIPLARELIYEVFQHSRECYPEEACGLLLGPEGGPSNRIARCTNVQTRRKLAGESDLDARHGYWIDERELVEVLRRAGEEGDALLWIYHSHVDTGPYFSHTDLDSALGPDGTPLWPGVGQLVISVYEDGVRDVAGYVWDDASAAFHGRAVQEVSQ
jgi:proteasome lid subunit RPN8/RPN11